MNSSTLEASIERALVFLECSQLPTGEFKVLRSTTDCNLQADAVIDSSVFATALIAYSLGFANGARISKILEKSIRFFQTEMTGPGVWRYWTRQHEHHSIIPPDLDDIACVSYVLRRHSIPFPSNIKLVMANRNASGLFFTWLTPRWPLPANLSYWFVVLRQWLNPIKLHYFWKLNESAPDDVDCVVNANVLFYLGESRATSAVVDYLSGIVRSEQENCCDKWHLNRFTFYYAISRCFHAGVSAFERVRDEVVRRIVKETRSDGSIGANALETALGVCALLYWKSSAQELERAVQFLLATQRTDGDWPRAVLYYGGPKKYYGWGSEELTTGFCVEALTHFLAANS